MIFLTTIIFIILFDQYTKELALRSLKHRNKISLFNGKIEILQVKNKGAAFNILEKRRRLLISITSIAIVLIIYYLINLLKTTGLFSEKIGLSIIIGGALGNLIDRVTKGYVTDFIYFNYRKLPVFNFADIFIFIGEIILIYSILIE